MITQWQDSETIVGRLRVAGARVDPAIAQLRLTTLLNSAVSQPAAFPPSAIIFIRKLHDPLPRSLRIRQHDLRPPAAWQQALNAKLETLVTGAARPALGAVPANAEAVVFLDRSELLASLATDWCERQVATRWWWQSLLRKTTASQIIKELWRSAPEYVPAAFDKLARNGKAATIVKTFNDAETHALLSLVVRAFRLDDLARVLNDVHTGKHSSLEKVAELRHLQSSLKSGEDSPVVEGIGPAPWNSRVRESETNGLGPEQQMFLGVVLMIQRAPATVRAKNFAREVETWQRAVIAKTLSFDRLEKVKHVKSDRQIQSIIQPSLIRAERPSTPRSLQPSSQKSPPHDAAIVSTKARKTIAAEKTPSTAGSYVPQNVLLDEALAPLEKPPSQSEEPSSPSRQNLTTLTDARELGQGEDAFFTEELPTAIPDQLPLTEFQITTDFGGVFYLINLGIYLGFYGDFTTPQEPGIELNIWDFVALLGREFLGERIEADPVWKLLERLAGRKDDEEPGKGFEPNIRDWLDELMPSVRARLQKALGLSETEDPGTMLCEQRARVFVTATHVDISIALADLPIQVRLAGLDRDPGWVPAAGRFINFHFE